MRNAQSIKHTEITKMGLDMFLVAKRYFWTKDYDTNGQDEKAETIKKMFPEMDGNKLDYVIFQVGYWRKANAIHKWFVDNVQDGEDDCGNYYVDDEKLQELKKICEKIVEIAVIKKGKVHTSTSYKDGKQIKNMEDGDIIENAEEVSKLLPCESGFFFGSTDYDQWYFRDIQETIKIIDKCLKMKDWEFEYHSSW